MTSSRSSSSTLAGFAGMAIMAAAGPAGPAAAQRPVSLATPIRCEIGRTCWIQKYADLAEGPERRDYRCRGITTDAHDGIDFRLASIAAMRAGVPVLAAAAGKVLRVRDGEPDAAGGAAAIGGNKEAGNGVVIDHGDGLETQYSHLANGSVRVRAGDQVAVGAPIGLVGLSGNTDYPHLHFSVRHRGTKIDPFTGGPVPGRCGDRAGATLWARTAAAALSYRPVQLVRIAFATAPQSRTTLQRGDPVAPGRRDPMLVMTEVIGVETGDVVAFDLRSADGRSIVTKKIEIERPNLVWVGYAGLRAPPKGWMPGRYAGTVILSRAGYPVQRLETQMVVAP